MSTQVETAFVQQYSSTLATLVQQKGSRLRSAVRNETLTGRYGFWDQIGSVEAQERTARHGNSPILDTPHARRRVSGRDFEWGDLVDTQDKVRMLIDPASTMLQSAMWSLGRKIDDLIITAATGTAYTGETGSTSVPLPTTQKIAVASTGLTLAKLLSAKEILDGNETDPDEPRYIACAAKQITNLLNTTEVKSADYNTVKALASGQLDTFLGFKFIRTQRLGQLTSTTHRAVIAWVQSGILLATQKDIMGRIAERADKSFANYAYACLTAGATRMEEKKVVQIACLET